MIKKLPISIKASYIWIFLKILISSVVLYLLYLDIELIIYYDSLKNSIAMNEDGLTNFHPELGIFSFAFFSFGSFLAIFGNSLLAVIPFLIVIISTLLLISTVLAILIFKEKAISIFILIIIMLGLGLFFLF